MEVFRCQICAEPYVASAKPSNCACCGAHQKHLALAGEYAPEVLVDLSAKSRENLERVLALEVDSSAFYRGASKVADSSEGQTLFVALAGIEAAHASIICRILGVDKPEELYEIGECSPAHKENLTESKKRGERAIHLYDRFAQEAPEPRVRQVLQAFVEVETDHLSFSG